MQAWFYLKYNSFIQFLQNKLFIVISIDSDRDFMLVDIKYHINYMCVKHYNVILQFNFYFVILIKNY